MYRFISLLTTVLLSSSLSSAQSKVNYYNLVETEFNKSTRETQFSPEDFRATSYKSCKRVDKVTPQFNRNVTVNMVAYTVASQAVFNNKWEVPAVFESHLQEFYQQEENVKEYINTARFHIQNNEAIVVAGWRGNNNWKHVFRKNDVNGNLIVKSYRLWFFGQVEQEDSFTICSKSNPDILVKK